MQIHIQIEEKNARVSMRKLPKAQSTREKVERTSTGLLSNQRIVKGVNPMTQKALEKLDFSELTDHDPEIDLGSAGRILTDETQGSAFHLPEGNEPVANFKKVEMSFNPIGELTGREPEKSVHTNLNEARALTINTKNLIPENEAVGRFAFKDAHQLVHTDGLTREFLVQLAKTLHEKKSCALLGSGKKGTGPLILRENGKPCRGFVFGQIEGKNYKVVVLLSDMELKTPKEIEEIHQKLQKKQEPAEELNQKTA